MLRILILLILCLSHYSTLAVQPIPITGSWQIVSYQVIGYPSMDEINRDTWLGKIIQIDQQIKLSDSSKQACPKFNYKITTENSEAQFLTGYKIKPNQLGIIEETIQLIEVTCDTDSWLKKSRWFVKISDIHMLGYWDGVIFFFSKQNDNNLLLITPQSVGMINSKSLFNLEILTKSLPKYTPNKDFTFYQKNKLMLKINPDLNKHKISSINIFDDKAIAPAYAKIGMTYQDVFKTPETIIDCKAGVGELAGKTICSFKNIPTIKYVFKPKQEDSPIKALENAELIEFIWIADPTLMEEIESPDLSIPEVAATTEVANTATIATATNTSSQVDNFKNQTARLKDIKNSINTLLKALPDKKFETAILDFNSTQQAWTKYSYKHCQWYSTFLGVADNMFTCMEKMARERADEIEIFLQKLKQLSIVPTE
ncbi:hypothetical protein QUF74_13340 [Candidatus Halobeggiatoa sp. HSG11]|nr:hypothetical protein [Candidatus Halobeggiatoa sp. HSG11]